MNEQLYLLIIMGIITGVILWQSYRINDFNVEGIIFGVRVPESYRDDSRISDAIKNYNRRITTLTLINAVIFLGLFYFVQKAYIIIIYLYGLILINIYSCYLANKRIKVIKTDIGWEKQSENKIYVKIGRKSEEKANSNLFYLAMAVSILGLVITILKLPSLPKMVPIHFGVNGPDNWVDSTTLSGKLQVIAMPLTSVICVSSMIFSAKFQAKKDNSNFNGGRISSLILKKSYSVKSMTKMLGLTSIGISLIILYGILLVVGLIEFTNTSNYIFMMITVCIIFLPLAYWIVEAKKAKFLTSEKDSKEKEIYRDDDKNYLAGMFYYNPNDPSSVVKKRIGYGLDFNYAHILGKVMFILGITMFIGIMVVMIVLNL